MMNDEERIVLKNGDMELEIAAGVGGAISRFGFWQEKDGKKEFVPLLRGHDDKANVGNPLAAGDMGVHTGIPYINRVEPCTYNGRTIGAEKNHPSVEHNIHGDAWQQSWKVESFDKTSAVISYEHNGESGFPFKYEAKQTISLSKDAFKIDVEVINKEKEASFPVGAGLHFYWVKTDDMTLTVANEKLQFDVKTDKPSAEERPVPKDLDCSKGKKVSSIYGLDANFSSKDGNFTIKYPEMDKQITVSSMGNYNKNYITICVPDWTDALCAEPLTHSVYGTSEVAKGRKTPEETGIKVLAPGESLKMVTKSSVKPMENTNQINRSADIVKILKSKSR
ncbi:MAG: hypothetical protein AB7U85_04210 [Alphaproteobacteria bacterium]